MTVTVNITTPPITRQELSAVFGNNPKIVRAFTDLLADVRTTLPDAVVAVDGDAANALATAVRAQQTADQAVIAAANAQGTANTALTDATTALGEITALEALQYIVYGTTALLPNSRVLQAGTNVTLTFGTGVVTINVAGAAPTGAAGGDLSGTYPNPAVHTFNGGTVFGTLASANAATPPALGTTTPNSIAATTVAASGTITNTSTANALVAGTIPTVFPGNTVMIGQVSNANAALILQRFTNTAPSGYLINAINANNTGQLFFVDVAGNLFAAGGFTFNPATTTTAPAAGGGGALPATPTGYATVTIGGTARKIAYY